MERASGHALSMISITVQFLFVVSFREHIPTSHCLPRLGTQNAGLTHKITQDYDSLERR